MDDRINVVDALGDEGAIFTALVNRNVLPDSELANLKQEDDSATVLLDGEFIKIEQALQADTRGTTGFTYIDGLLSSNGQYLKTTSGTSTFTYTFLNSIHESFDNNVGDYAFDYDNWTNSEKASLRKSLGLIENFADINFVPVADGANNADFKFVKTNFPGSDFNSLSTAGRAAFPNKSDRGFVYFNGELQDWKNGINQGDRIFSTLFHEVSHSLGLEHRFSNRKLGSA